MKASVFTLLEKTFFSSLRLGRAHARESFFFFFIIHEKKKVSYFFFHFRFVSADVATDWWLRGLSEDPSGDQQQPHQRDARVRRRRYWKHIKDYRYFIFAESVRGYLNDLKYKNDFYWFFFFNSGNKLILVNVYL